MGELPEDTLLDLGIQAAFGLDPELDAPRGSGVLEAFRRPDPGTTPDTPGLDGAGSAGPAPGLRYRLETEISRGGVGQILRAHDRDLGREVALKVLQARHRHNPELVRRFLVEARIGGQLQHPGIVPVHEIGLLADERPYFAMKLVRGQTLADRLAARDDPTEDRQRFLAIFSQVCQTVAYAHTRGVIHRDLKPLNIMVGAFGEVQVMDWGFAKVLRDGAEDPAASGEGSDRVQLLPDLPREASLASSPGSPESLPGSLLGTPAYMPPEQARGELDELDERSDVFGLGAILAEILTGRPPATGSDAEEVLERARRGDHREIRDELEHSDLDRELIELTLDCLEPRREDRPRNATEVARRLRSYLESLDRRARELQVRATRSRFRFLITLITLVSVTLGGASFLKLEHLRSGRRTEAQRELIQAMVRARSLQARAILEGDEALLARALREAEQAAKLASSEHLESHREDAFELHASLRAEVRDQAMLRRLDRLREERDLNTETLQFRFADAFRDHGIDVLELEAAEAARRIRQSSIGTRLVLALDDWAILHRSRPGTPRSRREVRDHLLAVARLSDRNPLRNRLRDRIREDAAGAEALDPDRLLEEALELPLEPSTFELLATALRGRDERRIWFRAQELHPGDFWINTRLAEHLGRNGEPDLGLQFARVATALRPESAYARYRLASALASTGQFTASLLQLGRSVELDPSLRSGWAYFRFARLLEENEEPLAREDLEPLIRTLEKIATGSTPYPHLGLHLLLAECHHHSGKTPTAIRTLEQALAHAPASSSFGPDPSRSLTRNLERYRQAARPDLPTFATIDWTLLRSHDPGLIQAYLEREPPDDGERARQIYLAGLLDHRRGEPARALERFEEAVRLRPAAPEPRLRRVECALALDQLPRAVADIREALRLPSLQLEEAWDLWIEAVLVRSGSTAREALEAWPLEQDPEPTGPARAHARNLRWALEQLSEQGGLAINCGGEEVRDRSGRLWGSDRFHVSPGMGVRRSEEIEGTEDDPIYGSSRVFFVPPRGRGGYRIPLPRGRYHVVLLFAETSRHHATHGRPREFSVRMEGISVRDDYRPLDRGFATADRLSHEVEVLDGHLEIELRSGRNRSMTSHPMVSGISITLSP